MDRISRAGHFIQTHGRDIDSARFEYHFRGGTKDSLLEVLARYQNPDGGFGRGLEPDISAPLSNPFATELALSICLEAGVASAHPLLRSAVQYLEVSQDTDGNWRFDSGVYNFPIAPWFAGWTWPNLNPSCPIAGVLRALHLGSQRLHSRVASLFTSMANPNDLLSDEYYAVRPYALYFRDDWEHPERELYLSGVLWWLLRQHVAGNLPDALHFFEYVHELGSFVGRNLPRHIVEEQLEALEKEQADDGGWPSAYAEHWRPPSTVANLLVLKRFGRL